jgi:serine/threonine-protein kinase
MGNNSNHTFLPTRGGVDLNDVQISHEPECLNLIPGDHVDYVVRPKSLIMETFDKRPGESFLLLELADLEHSGVYDYLLDDDDDDEARRRHENRRREELVNLDGFYIERRHWDEHSYIDEYGDEIDLPDTAKLTVRWLNGKILIVAKGSIWNSITATYDGRHERFSASQLRKAIGDLINELA